jgi:hypothetical protein
VLFQNVSARLTGGGAIFVSGGSARIIASLFIGCGSLDGPGGAMCVDTSTLAAVVGCVFEGNSALVRRWACRRTSFISFPTSKR